MAYLPSTYTPNWNTMASGMQPQMPQGLIWVDGETAAKAYQLPAGWPVNTPMALWDTNDTVIYLKSTNQMGMPQPLQVIHYQIEERFPKRSGAAGREDYTEQTWNEEIINKFASKQDLEELKKLIEDLKGDKK